MHKPEANPSAYPLLVLNVTEAKTDKFRIPQPGFIRETNKFDDITMCRFCFSRRAILLGTDFNNLSL